MVCEKCRDCICRSRDDRRRCNQRYLPRPYYFACSYLGCDICPYDDYNNRNRDSRVRRPSSSRGRGSRNQRSASASPERSNSSIRSPPREYLSGEERFSSPPRSHKSSGRNRFEKNSDEFSIEKSARKKKPCKKKGGSSSRH